MNFPAFNIKPGVMLQGLRPEMLPAMLAAFAARARLGGDVTITAGREGKHRAGGKALHRTGA
jgi:hypothetical protein